MAGVESVSGASRAKGVITAYISTYWLLIALIVAQKYSMVAQKSSKGIVTTYGLYRAPETNIQ